MENPVIYTQTIHTPAESRNATVAIRVSTHSRPKAAGKIPCFNRQPLAVSTHSRPKAAGGGSSSGGSTSVVSTHSRPKAAG